ncbi:helix-turn-helix domain-containing protein (plasmid) [Rossellomorea sp. AcN35-11]|nr:hypothetical protein [Rossellomorea aquimaris]WJV32263.1 helix-turn-helix domain-containing protein [Rossellomorea sp. AcN35-11]
MGIVETYRKKLERAQKDRETLRNLSDDIEDKQYLITLTEGKIQDFEKRLERLTSLGAEIQCDECQNWVNREDTDTMIIVDNLFLCSNCGTIVNKVLTAGEAETKWNLPKGTIKQDCNRGMLDLYIKKGLIRKSGKYRLVHELVGKLYYQKKKSDT